MKKADSIFFPVVTSGTPDKLFFDFGNHYFAVLEIEVTVEKEQNIVLAVGEMLSPTGEIERNPGQFKIYQEQTIAVTPGTSYVAMTMTHPGYNGGTLPIEPNAVPFRYAEIRGCSGHVKAFQHAYYGEFDDTASEFVCDSENLNRIWEFCKHTVKATTPFGIFIDGNRERQAYEGDTYINQLSYLVCQANAEIARCTIDRLFAFPTWPTEWWLSMIPIIHDYVLYTGDIANLRRWYEPLKKKTLLKAVCENGLLDAATLPQDFAEFPGFGPGERIRDIVDWPMSERDGYEFSNWNLVPNCWQYMALSRMAEISELLNEKQDSEFYKNAAKRSRQAIRSTMLKNGMFVDNPTSDHTGLHSCIFPVLWNVADESEKTAHLALLQRKGMACSVFCAQFLLECCFRNGLADYGLSLILSEKLRSWNNMIAKGATITMETWDDTVEPFQDWNHPWGASPANIIIRYIAGIRPTAPGFKKFIVDPQPVSLNNFKVKTPTPSGSITFEMLTPGKYILTVPDGTTAVFQGKILSGGQHKLGY